VHGSPRPAPDGSGDADHRLRLEVLRRGVRLRSVLGMEDELDDPLPVAEVDERHAAVIAAVGDPPAERHLRAGVLRTELAADVAPQRRREIHATTSSTGTDSCSPPSSSRTVTAPSATSRAPRISAYLAPV